MKYSISAVAGLGLIASATALAAPPQPVGITSAVLNQVTITGAGTRQARRAVLRQRVAIADQVQTGARSQLQVLLLDRATFTVGANAHLTIDRYVYDPATGRSFSASVARGAFRFMSGRPARSGNSIINTPVATIGIRGTIVDGVIGADAIAIASGERGIGTTRNADRQTATLIVLRGPGAAAQGNTIPGAIIVTAGGKSVSLDRPALAVFVPRAGAEPIGPFAISQSGLSRTQALIFPSLAEWRVATAPVGNTPYPASPAEPARRPSRGFAGPPIDDSGPEPGYGAAMPSMPAFRGGMTTPTQRQPQARPSEPATARATSAPTDETPAQPSVSPVQPDEPTPAPPQTVTEAPPSAGQTSYEQTGQSYSAPTSAPTNTPPPSGKN